MSSDAASSGASVLLVESDPDVGEALLGELMADGYRVALARSAEHARVLATHEPPRLALVGTLAAPRGALAMVEEIRGAGTPTWPADLPVVLLSARRDEVALVRAFEAGADDFLPRPPGIAELRVRLRALLARCERPRAAGRLHVGALLIDTGARTVSLDGRSVLLRRREFDLLSCLAAEPGRAFSRSELLRDVWGYASGATRTVDSHASRVRVKLRAAGPGRWIVGVWGVGYRLTDGARENHRRARVACPAGADRTTGE
jgi:DNA-binding response OmpR family regulator